MSCARCRSAPTVSRCVRIWSARSPPTGSGSVSRANCSTPCGARRRAAADRSMRVGGRSGWLRPAVTTSSISRPTAILARASSPRSSRSGGWCPGTAAAPVSRRCEAGSGRCRARRPGSTSSSPLPRGRVRSWRRSNCCSKPAGRMSPRSGWAPSAPGRGWWRRGWVRRGSTAPRVRWLPPRVNRPSIGCGPTTACRACPACRGCSASSGTRRRTACRLGSTTRATSTAVRPRSTLPSTRRPSRRSGARSRGAISLSVRACPSAA